jgi:hypothetical protein
VHVFSDYYYSSASISKSETPVAFYFKFEYSGIIIPGFSPSGNGTFTPGYCPYYVAVDLYAVDSAYEGAIIPGS